MQTTHGPGGHGGGDASQCGDSGGGHADGGDDAAAGEGLADPGRRLNVDEKEEAS
jgi:hypothetical protein